MLRRKKLNGSKVSRDNFIILKYAHKLTQSLPYMRPIFQIAIEESEMREQNALGKQEMKLDEKIPPLGNVSGTSTKSNADVEDSSQTGSWFSQRSKAEDKKSAQEENQSRNISPNVRSIFNENQQNAPPRRFII